MATRSGSQTNDNEPTMEISRPAGAAIFSTMTEPMPPRSSTSPLRFNEGKACDAVIREIARRAAAPRENLWSPEQMGDPDPVEFVFDIGTTTYAIEHTGIEPFAGHIHMSAQAGTHVQPIIDAVTGRLPAGDHYELQMPAGALRELRGTALRAVQQAIAEFVVATAPTLPLALPGRYVTPIVRHSLPGVPFSVFLHRVSTLGIKPPFSVTHVIDGATLEAQREDRVRSAYARKIPKLAAWRSKAGARTILALEDNDIQLTNPELVWRVLEKVERGFTDRPDEVWLVMTLTDDLWWCVPLRIEERGYFATAVEDRWPEYDPQTLDDLSMLL